MAGSFSAVSKPNFVRKSEKQKMDLMEMKKENKYDTTRTVFNEYLVAKIGVDTAENELSKLV